ETTPTYTLKVSVSDGKLSGKADITVNLTDVEEPGTRLPTRDIDLATSNSSPTGLWSDGITIWVADYNTVRLYAYTLADGTRDTEKDIATVNPDGLWSDGTTIWVAQDGFGGEDDKLYAYTLADGMRNAEKDINLATGNDDPDGGIWSDKTTLWVADSDDYKLYAYTLADGTRNAEKDISLANIEDIFAADNDDPSGIWSDGTTIWVVNDEIITNADFTSDNDKIYAYVLADGTRDEGKEINTLNGAGNNDPKGVWSDDTILWVVDADDGKLYAYRLK
ncbi:MAG: hypothetical protein GDA37_13180, partial [Ekhidna sp.]|nr:hypothetical protein [Ekhidna sp.]